MANENWYRLNPEHHFRLDQHTLSDGKTVLTHKATQLTATQVKEVLDSTHNGIPLVVEASADEVKAAEAAQEAAKASAKAESEAAES